MPVGRDRRGHGGRDRGRTNCDEQRPSHADGADLERGLDVPAGRDRAARRPGCRRSEEESGRRRHSATPWRCSTTAAARRSTRAALHDRGRRPGEPHREVGRREWSALGKRDEPATSSPSRSSTTAAARRSTRAATSRPRAAWRRTTSRNGTARAGRRWAAGWTTRRPRPRRSSTTAAARRSTRAATSRPRAAWRRTHREVGRLELVGAGKRDERRASLP